MESLVKDRLRVAKLFDMLDVDSIYASALAEMTTRYGHDKYSIDNIAVSLGATLESILKECVEIAVEGPVK